MTVLTQFDDIINDFKNEINQSLRDYLNDKNNLDDVEILREITENFVELKYNTFELTEYECIDFIQNNLRAYIQIEKYCIDWINNEMGTDEALCRGIVKIVNLWRYLFAKQYVSSLTYNDIFLD